MVQVVLPKLRAKDLLILLSLHGNLVVYVRGSILVVYFSFVLITAWFLVLAMVGAFKLVEAVHHLSIMPLFTVMRRLCTSSMPTKISGLDCLVKGWWQLILVFHCALVALRLDVLDYQGHGFWVYDALYLEGVPRIAMTSNFPWFYQLLPLHLPRTNALIMEIFMLQFQKVLNLLLLFIFVNALDVLGASGMPVRFLLEAILGRLPGRIQLELLNLLQYIFLGIINPSAFGHIYFLIYFVLTSLIVLVDHVQLFKI